jgi:hypothetical protein
MGIIWLVYNVWPWRWNSWTVFPNPHSDEERYLFWRFLSVTQTTKKRAGKGYPIFALDKP